MKKVLVLTILPFSLLVGCNEKSTDDPTIETSSEQVLEKASQYEGDYKIINNSTEEEKVEEEKNNIDTSIFEYAIDVDVTDARELNNHITVAIDLSPDSDLGMGTLNVLNQTYDFLQQDDITGAETIALYVRVNDIKVSQFKIHTSKFVPNDKEPMAEIVLKASEIEFLRPEVEAFGKVMELW